MDISEAKELIKVLNLAMTCIPFHNGDPLADAIWEDLAKSRIALKAHIARLEQPKGSPPAGRVGRPSA